MPQEFLFTKILVFQESSKQPRLFSNANERAHLPQKHLTASAELRACHIAVQRPGEAPAPPSVSHRSALGLQPSKTYSLVFVHMESLTSTRPIRLAGSFRITPGAELARIDVLLCGSSSVRLGQPSPTTARLRLRTLHHPIPHVLPDCSWGWTCVRG